MSSPQETTIARCFPFARGCALRGRDDPLTNIPTDLLNGGSHPLFVVSMPGTTLPSQSFGNASNIYSYLCSHGWLEAIEVTPLVIVCLSATFAGTGFACATARQSNCGITWRCAITSAYSSNALSKYVPLRSIVRSMQEVLTDSLDYPWQPPKHVSDHQIMKLHCS